MGEKIITAVLKPVTYLFPTLMSVPVRTVAKAMINNVTKPVDGTHIRELYENKEIHQISQNNKNRAQTKDRDHKD